MNPKLWKALIIIGLVTIVIIAVILVPRGLSVYFQVKGGQQIEYVLKSGERIDELVCEALPANSGESLKEVEGAIINLNRATSFNQYNSQAYYYLGKAHCLLGEFNEAKVNYLQFTELRPINPLGYILLGFVYEKLGNLFSAKNAWEQAGLKPYDFNIVGNEELTNEKYDHALLWYERSLLLNPRNIDALFGIGTVKESQNKWEAAIEDYKSVIHYDPSNIEAYYRVGEILLNQLNQFEESLIYFKTASILDDIPIRAYVGIGDANNRLGDLENALLAYQHAVELSPEVNGNSIDNQWERVWPYYALGSLQLSLGYFEDARDSFLMGIDLDKNNRWGGWLFWGLGRSSLLTEDYDQANLYFEQVLEETDYPFLRSQALFGLGESSIQSGDIEGGLNLVKLAHYEQPENQNLHMDYVKKLLKFGLIDEALKELEIFLGNWPENEEGQQLYEEFFQ